MLAMIASIVAILEINQQQVRPRKACKWTVVESIMKSDRQKDSCLRAQDLKGPKRPQQIEMASPQGSGEPDITVLRRYVYLSNKGKA